MCTDRRRIPGLLACVAAILLSAPAAAYQVTAITPWTTGATGPSRATAGTDRLLVFTAAMEGNANRTITSARYGGRTLTQVITEGANSSGVYARTYIFYLTDAQIAAATSDTFSVTWSGSTVEVHYAARMYQFVDQTDPIRDSDKRYTNSSTPNPIVTPDLTVNADDQVVAAVICGNARSYSWNNGFTEGTDHAGSTSQHSTADRSISADGSAAASATNAGPNRQALVAAVLAHNVSDPKMFYVRPDGDNANSGLGPGAGQAWASLYAATRNAAVTPNSIIHVMPGTYTEGIDPTIDGQPGYPIKIIGDVDGSVFGVAGTVLFDVPAGVEGLKLDGDEYFEVYNLTVAGSAERTVNVNDAGTCVLDRCEFYGSSSDDGVRVDGTVDLTIRNCLIHNNADEGIDLASANATVQIHNCTIANNGRDNVKQRQGSLSMYNCILYGAGQDGFDYDSGSITGGYCIIYGSGGANLSGVPASGTVYQVDPQFADEANDDYTLLSTSPAIDAGVTIAGVTEDFRGFSRPMGGGYEIGAHEYPLLGWWKLNDGGGTTAADSSGADLSGDVYGSLDWQTHCGGETDSLRFNGSSDYVEIAGGAATDLSQGFTFAMWLKNADPAANAVPIGKANQMLVLLAPTNLVYLVAYRPSGDAVAVGTLDTAIPGFDPTQWHHYAGSYNPESGALKLYVDGAVVASNAASADTITSDQGSLFLGRFWTGGYYFNGEIRGVRLYGTPLTDAEIAAMAALLAYWKLDETSGNTAVDSGPHGYHAALTGNPSWESNGKVGGALAFDGSGDYATTGENLLSDLGAFTIAAWIKPNVMSGSRIAIAGQNDCLEFGLMSPTSLQFWSPVTSTTSADFTGYHQKWTHVAAVGNGATVQLYINGQVVATDYDNVTSYGSSSYPVNIGAGVWDAGGNDFTGEIDDVRMYSRALCQDEINGLATMGKNGLRILKWVEVQ